MKPGPRLCAVMAFHLLAGSWYGAKSIRILPATVRGPVSGMNTDWGGEALVQGQFEAAAFDRHDLLI